MHGVHGIEDLMQSVLVVVEAADETLSCRVPRLPIVSNKSLS